MSNELQEIVRGIPASTGKIRGTARILLPGEDLSAFAEGEILVTTITDPTMIHAMIRAAGIVTNQGGITSHPAIISREMGIPCVVNTREATELIKNGMEIEIDGDSGIVYGLA